ncbi:MAG: DUF2793 domain-containing protein [Erythrobacter sp.]
MSPKRRAAPVAGDCWIVASDPSGLWTGRSQNLACYTGSSWVFGAPRQGMRLFDLALGQFRTFSETWLAPSAPLAPQGGSTVDSEARNALNQVISALKSAGIFNQS